MKGSIMIAGHAAHAKPQIPAPLHLTVFLVSCEQTQEQDMVRDSASWLRAVVHVQSLVQDPDLEDLCSIACADKQQCNGAASCGGCPSHQLKHTAEVHHYYHVFCSFFCKVLRFRVKGVGVYRSQVVPALPCTGLSFSTTGKQFGTFGCD